MRQVETCDFCGDRARGLYEPLPESMGDSPRFALCDGCRDRLATAVDPLLARLEEPATADSPDPVDGDVGSGEEPAPRAPDGAGPAAEPAPDPTQDVESDDVGGSRDAGGREKSDRRGTPPNYRKVMRFLENRTLPVERAEAEYLAAEAYDLEEGTVAAAIDHAVQYGRLREVDGQLKR